MFKLAIRSFGKKCSCDENFFKVWSPSMAYWLGMYFADGYISKDKRNTVLQLKCTDIKHVEKLKSSLTSTYAIGVVEPRLSNFCGIRHQITNRIITQDLIDLGCIPRKTFGLQWPVQLPKEHENHFVRGYFDGDGCVHFRKQNNMISIFFCGNEIFIKQMQECINRNVKQKARGSVVNQRRSWQLEYAGNISAPAILNWMYEESEENIRLDRKYALFQRLKYITKLPMHERLQAYLNYRKSYEWTQYITCYYSKCPRTCKQTSD